MKQKFNEFIRILKQILIVLAVIIMLFIIAYIVRLYLSQVSKLEQLNHFYKILEWGVVSTLAGLLVKYIERKK